MQIPGSATNSLRGLEQSWAFPLSPLPRFWEQRAASTGHRGNPTGDGITQPLTTTWDGDR